MAKTDKSFQNKRQMTNEENLTVVCAILKVCIYNKKEGPIISTTLVPNPHTPCL